MRILVVEDEQMIAFAIKKGLEQERHTVDVRNNGIEGLDLALAESYDLVILDRMLPEMDGLDICRRMRKEKNHTPVLMLTAKGEVRDKVEGLDAGADDYLPKPFSFDELLARVRALTRRPKKAEEKTVVVGDLSLNTTTFEVTRANIPILLSQKEFSLLEYLMRHAGSVCSKEQLISHVWNYDADILPNTVEVSIRNLRNKLGVVKNGTPSPVVTVRGFGYKVG